MPHQHRRPSPRCRPFAGWTCALLLAAGCDKPTDPPPPVPPALRIVAGEGQSDTVDAFAPARLEALVTDERGRPAAGVAVQFTAGTEASPGVLVRGASTGFQRTVAVATGQDGKAWVNVTMGQVAGPAQVVVAAPTLGLADTAAFTVRPGALAQLAVAPRDTAVYVDGSFALRVQAADRRGNAVADPLTYTARGAEATVAAGTVRGAAPGRTRVVVEAGGLRDSVALSVVPRGVLVARRHRGGLDAGLVTFGLDGSGFRVLTTVQSHSPRFMPDGSILFTTWEFGDLHRIAPDGTVQPVLQADGRPISYVTWPHPSRDGEWIYFTQFDQFLSLATPTRVRSDGTGLETVPGMGPYPNRGSFSPSPDGTHVAYFAELNGNSRDVAVQVSRVGSDDVLAQTPGHMPEWSPTGEWIAYVYANGGTSGPIRMMRPDGTGVRSVGNALRSYAFGIDWSPDGRWIVGAAGPGLELVNVETGQIIPLPFTTGMIEPSWKP